MEWTESIVIDRPLPVVHRAVADEHELMQWSAWPKATGDTCAVDGDGRSTGSAIVFRDRTGVEQGRQRLTSVEPDRIEYRLRNRGPAGWRSRGGLPPRRPRRDADARAPRLPGDRAVPPGARQLAELVLGRRVRRLHVEDLRLLKLHVETTSSTA